MVANRVAVSTPLRMAGSVMVMVVVPSGCWLSGGVAVVLRSRRRAGSAGHPAGAASDARRSGPQAAPAGPARHPEPPLGTEADRRRFGRLGRPAGAGSAVAAACRRNEGLDGGPPGQPARLRIE